MQPYNSANTRNTFLALTLIIVCAILISAPVSINGHLTGNDHTIHMKWYSHFSSQLFGGEIYPRWLAGMNAGMGSPALFFYGPLSYYITAAIHGILPAAESNQVLGISAGLALALSGISFYFWIRTHVTQLAALTGGLIYMILPYHVLIDLYQRFAFNELWAFAWLPLILWATRRIAHNESHGIFLFSLSYSLLILTHPPTTLLFSPLIPAYLISASEKSRRFIQITRLAIAVTLGIGLCGLYLAPAFLLQDQVALKNVATHYYENTYNFMTFGFGLSPDNGNTAYNFKQIAKTTLITMIISIAAWLATLRHTTKKHPSGLWISVSAISMFLMLPFSKPIWTTVSILQSIQFPSRLNVILTLSTAVLVTYFIHAYPGIGKIRSRLTLIGIGAILLIVWLPQMKPLYWNLVQPYSHLPQWFINDYDADEYKPKWVSGEKWSELVQPLPVKMPGSTIVKSGNGTVIVEKINSREYLLHVYASSALDVFIHQFYFPGWTAVLDDGRHFEVRPDSDWGQINLHLPQGIYVVKLKLTALPQEKIGYAISLTTLAILIAYLLFRVRLRSKKPS